MDRLNQLKGETGGSRDLTLDTSSPPSESFMTANETSTKYFSLSEVDSTFDVSPSKDSAISTTADAEETLTDTELISNLSPIPKKVDNFQIGKQIEAANILSGGVNIFDDNDNSYDGNELVIDDNVPLEDSTKNEDNLPCDESVENNVNLAEAAASTEPEVVLQIDGKNVDAIAIGNGLYLYRKGVEELAAVQVIDDNQQHPTFKFLKVRENAEKNLEVYEEIEVEVPNKVPAKEGKAVEKKTNVPVKDTSSAVNDTAINKKLINASPKNEQSTCSMTPKANTDLLQPESKPDVNLNGKKVKINESRKSPLISTFTPMTYHSTPNKEGIPLTKTMVDQQLHPNRHSDNVKKTIEVHTDSSKRESPIKDKDIEVVKALAKTNEEKMENPAIHEESTSSSLILEPKINNIILENSKYCDNKEISMNEKCGLNTKIIQDIKIQTHEDDLSINTVTDKPIEKVDCKVIDAKAISAESNTFPEEKSETKNVDLTTVEDKYKLTNNLAKSVKLVNTGEIENSSKSVNAEETHVEVIKDCLQNTKKAQEVNCSNDNINIQNNLIGTQTDCVNEDADVKKDDKIQYKITEEVKIDHKKNTLVEEVATITDNSQTFKEIDMANSNIALTDSVDARVVTGESDIFHDKIENEANIKLSNSAIPLNKISENNISIQMNKSQDLIDSSNLIASSVSQINTIEPPEAGKTDEAVQFETITNQGNILHPSKKKSGMKNYAINDEGDKVVYEVNDKLIQDVISNTANQEISNIDLVNITEDAQSINKDLSKKETTLITKDVSDQKQISEIDIVKQKDPVSNTISQIPSNTIENVISSKETFKIKSNIELSSTVVTTEIPSNKIENAKTPYNKGTVDTNTKTENPSIVAKAEITKLKTTQIKSSNSSSAVPFGKWTEANRQEFLNKIKETKIPCSNSNTKQIKQPNDLNRRDILKKIDTQRQAHQAVAKNQESSIVNKSNMKAEPSTMFVNKTIPIQKSNPEVKQNIPSETLTYKTKQTEAAKQFEAESISKDKNESKLPVNRKITNKDLIDKTIEGIINRAVSTKPHEEWKQSIKMDAAETLKSHNSIVSLDDMERKMNELHGIPFVERPAHELPQIHTDIKTDNTNSNKNSNIPHLLPFKNKLHKKDLKDNVTDNISDEEIIEHVPITGDMTTPDTKVCAQPSHEKLTSDKNKINDDESKKEPIITEKDFDKFVRRNSITYEKSLTVNFEGRESHNVIQTLVEKEVPSKKLTRNEIMLAESKAKSTNKQLLMRQNVNSIKLSNKNTNEEDSYNKNYQPQSKFQLAYQSALTAKRQLECPVTIIEDKPVKVVFLDSVSDFATSNLNVQGQELSPLKKTTLDSDSQSASESLDSDVVDTPYEMKLQDEIKAKSKHQRKQVLTPVDIPDLELIEPSDLGINESPKKKRKIDETKDKNIKTIAPKKSYLLNRAIAAEKTNQENPESRLKELRSETKPFVTHSDTISAIDNLVKAAELIETQSENKGNTLNLQISESPLNTPAKRGRGRPRKYPLSETSSYVNKTPINIQKKPRLIESNVTKKVIESDDSDSNDEFIKENWTMGKINENIVCPICQKLFRSENVVFKHVKHCTGPSPNRSDSDRRSLRQFSQSEGRSCDSDSDSSEESDDNKVLKPKVKSQRKSEFLKKEEIIVIEDTPIKEKPQEAKIRDTSRIVTKPKLLPKTDNLVCEFCGKAFRQLSYLVNHKQQHKKENEKKIEKKDFSETKSVFSCEVCEKEFRKLHHLVQHRIIHNSNPIPSRLTRKNSNDKTESNLTKAENKAKSKDDQSAGFRCEPCDKSFRKLHHLVEHRETHDGINKKGTSNVAQASGEVVKSTSQYVCQFCKKTFKKLQHLTDHKEQHLDSCSEKSDDKSVKSSLSTKDIIHECSLCYMVFPNEHSLNKHTVICLRKKKQAAAKQAKLLEQKEQNGEDVIDDEDKLSEEDIQTLSDKECESETINDDCKEDKSLANNTPEICEQKSEMTDAEKLSKDKIESNASKIEVETQIIPVSNDMHLKRNITEEEKVDKCDDSTGKKHNKIRKIEVITIPDTPTPKKKIAKDKDKRLPLGPKRQKSLTVLPPVKKERTPSELSDDDEIRYMLNPNFKEEDTTEGKVFMKVRANKRSSLQFERPTSKDLIKRRISLQNPPKVQRSKTKSSETKLAKTKTEKSVDVPVKIEHTDSDDSDVKYSFPETTTQSDEKEKTKTVKRQSIVAKRKSVTGIARRKSLVKHKLPIPTQKIKRRTTEAEHRCDCGQLFSSAALLSRHTTLAHTPPRVRRQRDPPPDKPTIARTSVAEKSKSGADNPKLNTQQKNKSAPISKLNVKTTRKSSAGGSESKTSSSKTVKSESNVKTLRSAAHKGVPVPDKMRKFMERSK